MKNSACLFTFAILVAIIVSSCGSSTSITKRRYNRGYYISHNSGKHAAPNVKARDNKSGVTSAQPIVVQAKPANDAAATDPMNPPAQKKEVITAERHTKVQLATSFEPRKNYNSERRTAPSELSVIKPFKSLRPLTSQRLTADRDDGLSLFWIVILVILILFAVGLIAHASDLIYILAVVALVLLILWLLRVL